ncbi:MAG: acetyl/propionyl/methylcrotonyl-CoA carboxylase subunit alpha [Candidatus Eisenbacteria bacterium]
MLVANRGEIACRILRAVRDEGGLGIAVYSDADRSAPHVRLADEAHRIGAAPAAESYLDPQRILDACRHARAELLHPGYGFLSENAAFAEAVQAAGIVWVGPPPAAMRAMGDKVRAREAAQAEGLPIVPGSDELPADPEIACAEAERIGYPVLIKAAFGGGGRGMRDCAGPAELVAALDLARREAGRAFGDATIYLEKRIENPRHVEIQILADQHGSVVHLGERECSIQRRHQKLLEEAPSPAPFPGLRERMGEAAVALARRIGYANAGTMEFLVGADGRFYFLEMNTRLQVEHPVTERVTGIDIVHRQLRIAMGERLDLDPSAIRMHGHAIECRINAEDPERGFLPSSGRIVALRLPEGPGVRNDVGFRAGGMVTGHYDPMVGKLIVWGESRAEAIARGLRALHEYRIAGIRTNIPFHLWLLAHPLFQAGETDTGFLERHLRRDEIAREREEISAVVAAAVAAYRRQGRLHDRAGAAGTEPQPASGSSWKWIGRPGAGGKGWR